LAGSANTGAAGSIATLPSAGAGGSAAGSANAGAGSSAERSEDKAATWQLGHVPSFLSAMGVLNTVLVFVYSTVLNRVATLKRRAWVPLLFLALVLAMGCLIVAYIFGASLGGSVDAILVDLGLGVWIVSFASIMVIARSATVSSVHREKPLSKAVSFADRSANADFGVEAIDRAIAAAVKLERSVSFPVLVIHDLESPGLRVATSYLKEALTRNEGVVYFTFSRPYSTIAKQLTRYSPKTPVDRLWIVDCYSSIYLPEEVPRVGRFNSRAEHIRRPVDLCPGFAHVLFADARDPSDVYRAYTEALGVAARENPKIGLRTIYETLSDFIKIADLELVMHYLRRMVVLEERRHIRALYLVWNDTLQGGLDQRYLQWFFSTTITMTKRSSPVPAIDFQIDRLLPQRVRVTTDTRLEFKRELLFRENLESVARVAHLLTQLCFELPPRGFLPDLRENGDYRMQVVNFLFYLVALEDPTDQAEGQYECVIGGVVLRGSNLLRRLAVQAKERDPDAFLAKSFESIAESDVAAMFAAPNGRKLPDVARRTQALRSCAEKLLELYGGDASRLLQESNDELGGSSGLLSQLQRFPAYTESSGWRTQALASLLRRERLFATRDKQLIKTSVDGVVITMALRSGMVVCEDSQISKALIAGDELDLLNLEVLREVTAEAIASLASLSQMPEDEVGDLLRAYGRESLRRTAPFKAADLRCEFDNAIRGSMVARATFVEAINGYGQPSHAIPKLRSPITHR